MMKLLVTASAVALALALPATATASPFLGFYKGRNANRAYVQENHVSYKTAAWLNGCWRENRSRILCNYKTYESDDDTGGSIRCTGQLRAQRDRYLGVWVEERIQYLDCQYREW